MKDISEMTAWETLKSLPNRIISLVWNLTSRWGVAMALTYILISKGGIDNWYAAVVWIIFLLFYLFKTEAPEMLERILKIKELK